MDCLASTDVHVFMSKEEKSNVLDWSMQTVPQYYCISV